MIPTARLMTMVGPTHGAGRFGLGRGGGTYRLRFERDFGMRVGPFHRAIHRTGVVHRLGGGRAEDPPVTTSDRSVRGGRAATGSLAGAARVAVVVLLAVVLGACTGASGGKASGSEPGAGAKAGAAGSPPLLQRTPSQFQTDIASLKGRVVIVNFWASWCGPCKSEMPALEQVSKAYVGKPVTLIGVDSSDVRDHADQLLTNLKITYPTVYDSKGIEGGIATAWSVASLPQTWFIARDGTRSGRIPRPLSAAELRTRIDQLL